MQPEIISYQELVRKRQKPFLYGVALISLVALIVYAFVAFRQNNMSDLYFSLSLIAFYLGFLLIVKADKIELAASIIAIVAAVGMFYYAYGDDSGNTGLFFLNAYPIFIFFLFGKQKGMMWTLYFSLALLVSYCLSVYGIKALSYEPITLRDFAFSFLITFGLVYIYQDLVDAGQGLIEARDRQLSEDRAQAQAVVTSIGEGVLVVNGHRRIISANPVAEKMLNLPSQNIIGRDLRQVAELFIGDAKVPDYQRPSSLALTSGRVVSVEADDNMFFHSQGGRRFPVSITASPLKHEGKISGAVVIFHDATEERAATELIEHRVAERTEEVRRAQAQLEASIESLKIGFIMTNRVPSIILLNTATQNILSQGKHEALTLNVIDDRLGDKVDLLKAIQQAITDGKGFEFNDIPYGSLFLHIFVTPIKAADETIGAVVLLEDVTEAKVIARSKDEFFSIASHELRTPLTAIRGYSSLLKKKVPTDAEGENKEWGAMAENIHKASIRLIDIVNDFLSTSRLEQGRVEFHPTSFDIKALIEEARADLEPLAAKKSLTLSINFGTIELPLAFADRDRVKEIIINLVGNAIKFTEKGSVDISVTPNKDQLEIRVRDTGKGIAPANQALLFRKFQQASASLYTQDASHGTGLGLYISKLMTEGMGGRIVLESSQQGKGSVFLFTLPFAPTIR